MKIYTTLIMIFLFYLSPLSQEKKTLLFTGHEHPPWHFQDSSGALVGINVDLTKIICKRLNISCKFEYMPWARSWETARSGKSDAIMSASRKKAREPYLYYPKEDIRTSEYVFFVHVDNKKANIKGNYEDIKKNSLSVGIQHGASYNKEFWKHFPYKDNSQIYDPERRDYAENIKAVPNPIQNFKKLSLKRIDVFPFDRDVGLYQIKKQNLQEQLTFYSHVLFSKGYPISFVKKSNYPDLYNISKLFEQELIKIKKEGIYNEVVKKWVD